jgi:uncharacterized protein
MGAANAGKAMDHSHSGTLIDGFAALCGAPFGSAAFAVSLFVAGLAGGFTHCAGMCGPFVLAQVSERLGRIGVAEFGLWSRLQGAALAPYQLGRLTTYTALGALAGGAARTVLAATEFRWMASVLLLIAAGLFLAQIAGPWLPAGRSAPSNGTMHRLAAAVARPAAPLFSDPRGWRGYALGVLLGFLPCGLLYSALAAAAASGEATSGALGMAAFALGTMPALFAVGYGGVALGRRWRDAMQRLSRPVMALNAVLLIAVAVRGLL